MSLCNFPVAGLLLFSVKTSEDHEEEFLTTFLGEYFALWR